MIGKFLTFVFGPSWRTSVLGIIVGGSGFASIINQGRIPTPEECILYGGIIVMGYHGKDKDVTGI